MRLIKSIMDRDEEIAQLRFSIIEPFVRAGISRRIDVIAQAQRNGINAATIYRWLKLYRVRSEITDLIPKKRGWTSGKSRLSEGVSDILDSVINSNEVHLDEHSPTLIVQEVERRCAEQGSVPPSSQTVRQHIRAAKAFQVDRAVS